MVKVGGQQTKEFGGEIYRQYHAYERKGIASFIADRLRMEGYKARVLQESEPGWFWIVYRRKVSDVSDREYIKKLANYCRSLVEYKRETKSYNIVTMMGYKEHTAKTLQQVERIIIKDYKKIHPLFPSYLVLQKNRKVD